MQPPIRLAADAPFPATQSRATARLLSTAECSSRAAQSDDPASYPQCRARAQAPQPGRGRQRAFDPLPGRLLATPALDAGLEVASRKYFVVVVLTRNRKYPQGIWT